MHKYKRLDKNQELSAAKSMGSKSWEIQRGDKDGLGFMGM